MNILTAAIFQSLMKERAEEWMHLHTRVRARESERVRRERERERERDRQTHRQTDRYIHR